MLRGTRFDCYGRAGSGHADRVGERGQAVGFDLAVSGFVQLAPPLGLLLHSPQYDYPLTSDPDSAIC